MNHMNVFLNFNDRNGCVLYNVITRQLKKKEGVITQKCDGLDFFWGVEATPHILQDLLRFDIIHINIYNMRSKYLVLHMVDEWIELDLHS